ncbi:hypothetical protein AB9K17_24110, partial [Salmonella enterica subsp. enterica serovar Kentucky]|uniref:hypothetical protein n=1 Tax=Salmonella enterica TaxID=28901 RepID=UPI003F4B94C6
KQYASHPYQSLSNVILTMESGNHYLQDTEIRFGQYPQRINSLIMIAEHPGTKIVFKSHSEYNIINNYIYYAQYIQIKGITFVGSFVHITVSDTQEVVINNCNFQGVSFGLLWVTNATFSRCAFTDYRRYHHG